MRLLALILAILSSAVVFWKFGGKGILFCVIQIQTLAGIFFPEAIGSRTGYFTKSGYVDKPTPAAAVEWGSWVLLLLFCYLAGLIAFKA